MSTFKKIAVTSRQLCAVDLPQQIRRLTAAGELRPDMIIIREKDLAEEAYEILAGQVMAVCRAQRMECVLHSYPETHHFLKRKAPIAQIHTKVWMAAIF